MLERDGGKIQFDSRFEPVGLGLNIGRAGGNRISDKP